MARILTNEKLVESVEYSRRKLEPFRRQRLAAVKAYTGAHYTDEAAPERMPVNFLEMAISVYKRQLAASAPRVVIQSNSSENRGLALDLEIVMNKVLKEMRFENTLSSWVTDALFSVGIMKVGLSPSDETAAELEGIFRDSGSVFAETVDLDDFVVDMTVSKWDQPQYIGNRYQLPYEYVIETDLFGDQTKNLKETIIGTSNEQGDERIESVSIGGDRYQGRDTNRVIEFWDIYLPYERKMVTFQSQDDGGLDPQNVVAERDWTGPEEGPYHILGYGDVPGNLMPLSPIANLIDLNDLSNSMFRKLGRQANRQKTITIVAGGAEEDGERIVRSNDGDTIRSDRPEATREAKFGGVDQSSLAFLIQLKDMFSYLGGNLDTLGGLSKGADTLGQERLLKQASSMKIVDMQERTTSAVKKVMEVIAKYIYYDPIGTYPFSKDIEDTGIKIRTDFRPEVREADFVDFDLDIAPYSMQDRSPAERVQSMMEVMQGVILPMAPQMMQMGVKPDMKKFLHYVSKYSNTPELDEILGIMTDEDMAMMQDPQDRVNSPPVTTRRYIREGRSGQTGQGRDDDMIRLLMGSDPNVSNMGGME
tara:strand:- start:4867 stop:6639 length:1773 start_codon:yes stop_codon:yes gene_type:complete